MSDEAGRRPILRSSWCPVMEVADPRRYSVASCQINMVNGILVALPRAYLATTWTIHQVDTPSHLFLGIEIGGSACWIHLAGGIIS